MIDCRTLGPVEVSVDGAGAPAPLLWRKNLALLIYLARSPKRTRSREHLVGLLWGDKPEAAARHSLNEAVRVLRLCAGEEGVASDARQVRLAPGAVELDTDRFEALVASGDVGAAAALVAGDFLEGFGVPGASAFDDWLAAERLQWRRRSLDALVRHSEALIAAGRVAEASDAAQRALALDATCSAAMRALLRARALAGDRAGALKQYDAFVARLAADVGAVPDAETLALAERVRRERVWRLPERLRTSGPSGPASRRAPLAGRCAELARLGDVWAACRRERRAAVAVIEGEGGHGKTRLAEELVARARLDGAAVAAVRAVEADTADPWSGVLGIARSGLLEARGAAGAPSAALARLRGEPGDATPAWALAAVAAAVAEERPVAMVADDAHWLDRPSLLALDALVRDLAGAPLLLVVTVAPHPPRAELDALRARVGREVAGVALRLGPLDADALRELARWALPAYDAVALDRVTRRVATDSAGIPLLAVELLHAVASGLDLRQSPGAWPEPLRTLDQTLPGALPDAVVAAVRVGFRRLSADAQRVLAAAAVLGGRVPAAALERAAEVGGDALAAALDELEWQRWLTAEARGYAFVARIVRDIVARDMVTAGQRERIRAAARA